MKSSAQRSRGFTLVEIMIAVGIVGILSAIAIPSYRSHVLRVKRTEAKVELTQRAQNLERCFTRFNRYDHANCTVVDDLPADNDTGTYRISVGFPRADGSQYLLTATPINGQAGDTKCGSLTIDQVGNMAVSTATPATDCWQR